jgi:hypothetical protein
MATATEAAALRPDAPGSARRAYSSPSRRESSKLFHHASRSFAGSPCTNSESGGGSGVGSGVGVGAGSRPLPVGCDVHGSASSSSSSASRRRPPTPQKGRNTSPVSYLKTWYSLPMWFSAFDAVELREPCQAMHPSIVR